MDTTETVILIVHTFIAVILIVLVLLQRGKGADAGAAFGSGASGTVFGSRGSSNFFSRATAILATAFFASSLVLAYLSSQHSEAPDSLLENAPAVTTPGEPVEDEAAETPAGDAGEVPELPDADEEPAADAELPALEPVEEPAEDPEEDDNQP
jgi:preprotein translocase subunit SecG